MSAENAWRIAMEFAVVAGNPRPTADFEAAFRAEVEAEAEELRGMLAELAAEKQCRCMLISRDTEREYETGTCIHQRARALLSRLEAKGEPK